MASKLEFFRTFHSRFGVLWWFGSVLAIIAPKLLRLVKENMKSYYDREAECVAMFDKFGDCWHLSTSENFEIIFSSVEEFKAGMGIVAICARLFPDVRVFTFEIMSNHFHFMASAGKESMLQFFSTLKKMLSKYFTGIGRNIDFEAMGYSLHQLDSVERVRNVIVYDNRNGYLVNPDYTPYSYPWGANRLFFNDDAKILARNHSRKMTFKDLRALSHSHKTDTIQNLFSIDGCASPLFFCDIEAGEQLFHDAAQYFYLLSKKIENSKQIAKEIGESIFYTDNELFSIIIKEAREKYGCTTLNEAAPSAKIELARIMRYDYNASAKQIMRFLKLPLGILNSMGIK